jgi:hypothetical protein
MDIEIIGFNVINGEYNYHALKTPKIVHSPQELLEAESQLQQEYDLKLVDGYEVRAAWRALPAISKIIKQYEEDHKKKSTETIPA